MQGGPIAVMVAFALCDASDEACSLPDFMMNQLPHAWEAPPAMRLAAWCVYMRTKCKSGADGIEPAGVVPKYLCHSIING